MRIAILPFGNPREWRYVEYCYQRDQCAEGFTTLNLLKKSDNLRPDLVLIYALDTLVDDVGKGYNDIVSSARKVVEDHICLNDGLEVVVEVVPGIMRRRVKSSGRELEMTFRANPNDIVLRVMYHIYSTVLGMASSKGKEGIEVLIDTSHGINYFTLLVREAALEALAALAIAIAPIKVKVFNSDPFKAEDAPKRVDRCTPGKGVIFKVMYNMLYELSIRPWDLIRYVRYEGSSVNKILSDLRGCNISESDVGEVLRLSKRVVAAYRTGALIELVRLMNENRDLDLRVANVLSDALACWFSKVSVVEYGGSLGTSFVKFQDGFRLLIHAHAIINGVKRLINVVTGELTLSDLKNLRKSLLEGSEITGTLVDIEIGVIAKLLKDGVIVGDWRRYSEIRLEDRLESDLCRDGIDDKELERVKRNFIAHAGFLKDFIELRLFGDDVQLRIHSGCEGPIQRVLDSVFKDLTK